MKLNDNSSPLGSAKPGSCKILVVDDNQDFRDSLHHILWQSGHEVFDASDGREALDLLGKTRVDVVATDILMPNLDGLQTIAEIRTRWPKVKVIAFSGGGYCEAGMYTDLSLKLGASCALEKPFTVHQILQAINGVS